MGFSNCTLVLVYSAVSSSAVAHAPASCTHNAVVACSLIDAMTAAPSVAPSPRSRSVSTRTSESSTIASGRPVVVVCFVIERPSAFASTMNTPTPVVVPSAAVQVAGTRRASATRAAGTQALVPFSTQPPSGRAVAVVAGSRPPGRMTSPTSSARAAVRMVSPPATPESQLLRWASVPNCAIGRAPYTMVSTTGT